MHLYLYNYFIIYYTSLSLIGNYCILFSLHICVAFFYFLIKIPLEAAGAVYLKNQLDAYHNVTNAIEKILNYTDDGQIISPNQASEGTVLVSMEFA